MAELQSETLNEMESRHKKELRELEGKVRAMLKSVKKAEKAVFEAQIIQMQFDLKARHNEELDALTENLDGMFGFNTLCLLKECFL